MEENVVLEEHLVAYIDLLGFKASINDKEKQQVILELLYKISSLKSEYSDQSGPAGSGITHYLTPSVSTFSDHVVISFPTGSTDEEKLLYPALITNLAKYISHLASLALQNGFLIRGGLAKGELYHKEGVIFGKALIDAYILESEVAIYPRVVVAMEVVKEPALHWQGSFYDLRPDDIDELLIIDYFYGLIDGSYRGEDYISRLKQRVKEYRQVMEANIKQLSENQKALAKWKYFRKSFNAECLKMQKIFPDLSDYEL